jgi:hypothetical protein
MTEYVIKQIRHRWIVYADRLTVGACADENKALQLVLEDRVAKARSSNSTDHKSGRIIEQNQVGCWQAARAVGLTSS